MGTTWKQLADVSTDQTLTNKTLTSPVLTTPQIDDTSEDHQYVFAASELVADRTVTLPLLTGNDEFVFKDHAQTLTNKTLTAPVLTAGSTTLAGEIKFLEGTDNGVNTVTLRGAAATSDVVLLLPAESSTLATQNWVTSNTVGSSVALGSEVSGTLPAANGGTGVASITALMETLDDETWTFANNVTLTGDLRVNGNDITFDAEASTIGPIGQTGGGVTDDLAGANFTINSGASTGNKGSNIIFKVPRSGVSGNDANSLVTALTITGDSNANGTVTVAGNLVASGNLTVSGTTTTVNTETINLADNAINLNSNWADDTAPTEDCGVIAYRGDGSGAGLAQAFYWDEDLKSWNVGNTEAGSNTFTQTAAVVCAKVMTINTSLTQATTDDAHGAIGHMQIKDGAVYIRTE